MQKLKNSTAGRRRRPFANNANGLINTIYQIYFPCKYVVARISLYYFDSGSNTLICSYDSNFANTKAMAAFCRIVGFKNLSSSFCQSNPI